MSEKQKLRLIARKLKLLEAKNPTPPELMKLMIVLDSVTGLVISSSRFNDMGLTYKVKELADYFSTFCNNYGNKTKHKDNFELLVKFMNINSSLKCRGDYLTTDFWKSLDDANDEPVGRA